MILRIILITICLGLSVQTALAAIAPPRPFSGEGLLVIRPFPSRSSEPCCTLPIYGEPGVERITDLESSDLPSLTPVIQGRTGEYAAAVTGKKGNWLHIVYDEAGREGWLKNSRAWEYVTWNHFLKGRAAKLLPGLKKEFYLLRHDPSATAPQLEVLSRQKNLRIIDVREDWALVLVDLTAYGWLRWRDSDGRFTISIDEKFDPQKH
ncbi:hypothetical protein Geob_0932 [Geotalea daltonii FRC-32]|uniref:SH3b domain-containing protein n=1 Tax=Geotalea daltonii (strain DSM 22248 / JCM 15807 / FRC-32) TaxID=316067 RepID=B9M1Z8_GEODF|nr:hypothetical protein [Geotalea daltonii]ACM19294.1 hypothetical protein Geob_0932 [Geotalea daltonii FRC-32]